jgi:hypothetical protein
MATEFPISERDICHEGFFFCRPLQLQLRGEILPIQITRLLENFSFNSHAFSISGNAFGQKQPPWEKNIMTVYEKVKLSLQEASEAHGLVRCRFCCIDGVGIARRTLPPGGFPAFISVEG